MGHVSRTALSIGVAALFAGCGGPQPPIAAKAAGPQSRAVATHAERGESWMLPEASNDDLIYIAGNSPTAVISYATGKLVGTIDGGALGACSDSAGNVFFVHADASVTEYNHGGTTPIATLYLPAQYPTAIGCAVDASTGNLAVTYGESYPGGSDENVAVFESAKGTPTVYQSGIDSQFCAYDNKGNLFVDGYAGNDQIGLAELPSGGSSFTVVSFDGEIGGSPWSILWDGKYLTLEGVQRDFVQFSRVQVAGSSATIVGTTRIAGKMQHAHAAWLVGNVLLIPFAPNNVIKIGFWRYPKGGKPTQVFTHKNFGERFLFPQGLTVSVAPAR
jgi:hypothetical protein